MSPRQKFWLKLFLFVTFPVWVLPAIAGSLIFVMGLLVWAAVGDLVEPSRYSGLGGGR